MDIANPELWGFGVGTAILLIALALWRMASGLVIAAREGGLTTKEASNSSTNPGGGKRRV